MRKYVLASTEAREDVDLREYGDVICNAVKEIMTEVEDVKVIVERSCYYVSPTPSKGDAVRIGRLICKSDLKKHCVQIPKLFSSMELSERGEKNGRKQNRMGGHM